MSNSTVARGSTIIPCVQYRNAPAMIEWLCNNLGFAKKAVYPNEDGSIAHAELTLGAGMIMLGSLKDGESATPWSKLHEQPSPDNCAGSQSPYVYAPDPDAVHARVTAHGGEILIGLENKPYGGRDFTCRDPEGHVWTIGSYNPWEVPS